MAISKRMVATHDIPYFFSQFRTRRLSLAEPQGRAQGSGGTSLCEFGNCSARSRLASGTSNRRPITGDEARPQATARRL